MHLESCRLIRSITTNIGGNGVQVSNKPLQIASLMIIFRWPYDTILILGNEGSIFYEGKEVPIILKEQWCDSEKEISKLYSMTVLFLYGTSWKKRAELPPR